jgi:hypothetical protein
VARLSRLWLPLSLLLAALLLAAPLPAAALELPAGWSSSEAEGLRIHHRPGDAPLAASLARNGPPVRRRLAAILNTASSVPVDVVLIPAGENEARSDARLPTAPDWASGFTVAGSGVLFVRVRTLGVYPDRDLTSVFAHELAHAELGALAGPGRLPRWFEEGTCMVLARPWDLRDTWSLTLALLFHERGSLTRYEGGFPEAAGAAQAAYAESFAFVSWLAENGGGAAALGRVARRTGAGESFEAAFALEFGLTTNQALEAWRASVGRWVRIGSILTGTTTLWLLVTLLLLGVWIRRRRHSREILARWEMEEGPDEMPPGPLEPR